MATAYDEVLYPSGPQARLHIDNLYLCAALNGYRPADVNRARVLEIGCGTGFNLLPMALESPNASFVGLDYAALPIRIGTEVAASLKADNLQLVCADISQPDLDLGQFDYIIAHGLYSWIPEPVRTGLWSFIARSLSPNGVFHVSYNALPGWYTTIAMRDFIRTLSPQEKNPRKRLDLVWEALGALASHADSEHLLALEATRIRSHSKEVLFHDEMGEFTQPFYLHDVMARAEGVGLRYISEADLRRPSGIDKYEDVSELLAKLVPDDPMYLRRARDFTSMRRFHDSLFTQADHKQQSFRRHEILERCWAYSDIRLVGRDADGSHVFEHSKGLRITTKHPLLCALAGSLQSIAPQSVCLGEFWRMVAEDNPKVATQLAPQFWSIVIQLVESGALHLRLHQVPVANALEERPRVSPFCRVHAVWDNYATNAYHRSSSVPEGWQRAMLTLLDGSRDKAAIAQDLAAICWQELQNGRTVDHPSHAQPFGIADANSLREEPGRAQSEEALRAYFETRVDEVLQAFLRAGYLV